MERWSPAVSSLWRKLLPRSIHPPPHLNHGKGLEEDDRDRGNGRGKVLFLKKLDLSFWAWSSGTRGRGRRAWWSKGGGGLDPWDRRRTMDLGGGERWSPWPLRLLLRWCYMEWKPWSSYLPPWTGLMPSTLGCPFLPLFPWMGSGNNSRPFPDEMKI